MSRRKGVSMTRAGDSPKNIVVFGESGVGKSSLINLIAGRPIAATSSSAKGCTFQHTKYDVEVDGATYAIWDTAGLDEGVYGTVPAEIAEENLKQLLHDLSRAHGIHLLVYCVRASRLRKTLLRNYNLFYSAICRKKVPIVAVVTGLENHEGEMEDWWTINEREVSSLRMHFDGHACVTTLDADKVNSPILRQRCHASRRTMLSLLASACARDRWAAEREGWVSAALADVRAMARPARPDGAQPTPIIALHDLPDRPLDPTAYVKDTPFEGGRLMDVGRSPLLVYRIREHHLRAGSRFKKHIALRDADLLIMCASVRGDPGAARRAAAAFSGSYGGATRPLLIVVRDAPSDGVAREWWRAPGGDGDDKDVDALAHHHQYHQPDPRRLQAIVRALPPPGSADGVAAIMRLQQTIQTRALQPVDMPPAGCFRWLVGGRRTPMVYSPSVDGIMPFVREDCLTNAHVWAPWRSR